VTSEAGCHTSLVNVSLDQAAAHAWQRLIEDPGSALLAFDFDGTLSPISEDPGSAGAHHAVTEVLARLGPRVCRIAVVTGRPVEAVRRLSGFEGVDGLESVVVLGQYGFERWDAATGEVHSPPPPDAIAHVRAELPGVLASAGWPDAFIEDKGRAVAVHVRRLPDPNAAFDAVLGPVRELAQRHGLAVEPGRHVVEVRAPGMDKGIALRGLVQELAVRTVLFAGDDFGDLPAFDAVAELRADGIAGLRVCSASGERAELVAHTDLAVDGPDGVVALLSELADVLESGAV